MLKSSGKIFPREITRTWTATDDEGNTSVGQQVITVPSPIYLDAGADQTVYVDFLVSKGYPYSGMCRP